MTRPPSRRGARTCRDARGHRRFTVNSGLPGPPASEGVGGFVEQLAAAQGVDPATVEREFFATARPSSLLRRFASPDEVAAMIVVSLQRAGVGHDWRRSACGWGRAPGSIA